MFQEAVEILAVAVLRQGLGPRFQLRAVAPLVRRAGRELRQEGFAASSRSITRHLDVRYVGQSYEITVPYTTAYRADFDRRHQRSFGYMDAARAIEVVNVRVIAAGLTDKPSLAFARVKRSFRATPRRVRRGRFAGRQVAIDTYRWDTLDPGAGAPGPAVVAGAQATAVIPPGFAFRVDGFGNLIVRRSGSRPRRGSAS